MITVNKPVLQEEDWGELSEYSSGGLQSKWDEEDDELMCLHNPDINPGMQLTKLQTRYEYWIKQRANAKALPERAAADAMLDMIREAMDNSICEVECE